MALIYWGEVDAASDTTMAFTVNTAGTSTRQAIIDLITPVAAGIIAGNPTIIAAVEAALASGLAGALYRGDLPAGTDLNQFGGNDKNGSWRISATGHTNGPGIASSGVLEVIRQPGTNGAFAVLQRVTDATAMWWREAIDYGTFSWGAWKKVVTSEDVSGGVMFPTTIAYSESADGKATYVHGDADHLMEDGVASITKMFTVWTARQFLTDTELNTTATVQAGDMSDSPHLKVGDVVSYRNLFHAAIISSDSTAPNVIARAIGTKISPTSATPRSVFYAAMQAEAERLGYQGASFSMAVSAGQVSARHVVDLFRRIRADAQLGPIPAKLTYSFTVTGPEPRTINIAHTINPAGDVPIPEFRAGKTGSTSGRTHVVVEWRHPDGTDHITAILNCLDSVYYHRYKELRKAIDATSNATAPILGPVTTKDAFAEQGFRSDQRDEFVITDQNQRVALKVHRDGSVSIPKLIGGGGGGSAFTPLKCVLVVMLGQSNGEGRGRPVSARLDPLHSRIRMYDWATQTLKIATVPLSSPQQQVGLSPATPIARRFAAASQDTLVTTMNAAAGGSRLTGEASGGVWRVDYAGSNPALYPQTVTALQNAIALIQAQYGMTPEVWFYWVQGESDSSASQAEYAAELDKVITGLRGVVGDATAPFTIGGVPPEQIVANPGLVNIRAAHMDTQVRNTYAAYADGIPGGGGSASVDDILHYNRAGILALGEAMFTASQRAATAYADQVPHQPLHVEAHVASGDLIVSWSAPDTRYTSFVVEYRGNGGAWVSRTTTNTELSTTFTGVSGTPIEVRVASRNGSVSSVLTIPVLAH